jgi:hypothetical protein
MRFALAMTCVIQAGCFESCPGQQDPRQTLEAKESPPPANETKKSLYILHKEILLEHNPTNIHSTTNLIPTLPSTTTLSSYFTIFLSHSLQPQLIPALFHTVLTILS